MPRTPGPARDKAVNDTKPNGPLTIRDLAKLANTSTATISRVLSEKPGVSDVKRRSILELVERLGYSPNRIAQNLALQKSHTLGYIAADLRNAQYVSIFRYVQRFVEPSGYQILIADSHLDVEKERRNIQIMRQHRAEGLIIFPLHDWNDDSSVDHLVELKLSRFPFVIVGRIDGYGFDSVTSEEFETARELAGRLFDAGHKRIAFVGAEETNRCIRERLAGVRRAARDRGEALAPGHIVPHKEGWPAAMMAMLRRKDRPTALVMMNDVCALTAWPLLTEAGFNLPADLSIVSFGDNLWSSHLRPRLTTTVEDVEEVARVAMELLMRRTEDSAAPPRSSLIPQRIIKRDSLAPPPARPKPAL